MLYLYFDCAINGKTGITNTTTKYNYKYKIKRSVSKKRKKKNILAWAEKFTTEHLGTLSKKQDFFGIFSKGGTGSS